VHLNFNPSRAHLPVIMTFELDIRIKSFHTQRTDRSNLSVPWGIRSLSTLIHGFLGLKIHTPNGLNGISICLSVFVGHKVVTYEDHATLLKSSVAIDRAYG